MRYNKDLFRLISSLKRGERAFIKQQLGNNEALFEIYNLYRKPMSPPSEAELKFIENLKDKEKRVYGIILSFLSTKESHKDPDKEIMDILLKVKVFYRRALFREALDHLKLAKKRAKSYDAVGLLILINKWERLVLGGETSKAHQKAQLNCLQELTKYVDWLSLSIKFKFIRDELARIKHTKTSVGDKAVTKRKNELFQNVEQLLWVQEIDEEGQKTGEMVKRELNPSSELEMLFCGQYYYDPILEKENYKNAIKEIDLFHKKNSAFTRYNKIFHLQSLLSRSLSALASENLTLYKDLRSQYIGVLSSKSEPDVLKLFVYQNDANQYLGYIILSKMPKKEAMLETQRIYNQYFKWADLLNDHSRYWILINLLEVYIRHQEYNLMEKVLVYLEDIKGLKKYLEAFKVSLIYKLICQFEDGLGETDVLKNYVTNFRKKKNKLPFTNSDIAFGDFLLSIYDKQDESLSIRDKIKIRLNIFKETLLELRKIPKEKKYLELGLPYDVWVNNTLKNY